jgi:hypothetical protein
VRPWTFSRELACQAGGRNRDVGELIDGRLGNDTAIGQEQHTIVAEAAVVDFHDHAAGGGRGGRGHLDDLEEGTQCASGDFTGAADHAIRLVHGDHHRTVVIRMDHRLPGFLLLDALAAPQRFEALGEQRQILAFRRVDDSDPLQGHIQLRGTGFDLRAITQEDRHTES